MRLDMWRLLTCHRMTVFVCHWRSRSDSCTCITTRWKYYSFIYFIFFHVITPAAPCFGALQQGPSVAIWRRNSNALCDAWCSPLSSSQWGIFLTALVQIRCLLWWFCSIFIFYWFMNYLLTPVLSIHPFEIQIQIRGLCWDKFECNNILDFTKQYEVLFQFSLVRNHKQ